ncbi:MaoC family dehydratase N-terminal domain-containing protein [soil metagenome]
MAEPQVTFELPVDAKAIAEFAAAVGEDNTIYFDPEAAGAIGLPAVVAPPTFSMRQAFAVTRDEREERLGTRLEPGRVLHGEQEFLYRRLPFAGEVLKGTLRVAEDFTKEGRRGGRLRFVTYESRFTDSEGAEVLTARYTLIETTRDPGA